MTLTQPNLQRSLEPVLPSPLLNLFKDLLAHKLRRRHLPRKHFVQILEVVSLADFLEDLRGLAYVHHPIVFRVELGCFERHVDSVRSAVEVLRGAEGGIVCEAK